MSSGNSEHQVSECPGLHQVKYPATDDPRLTGQDWAGLLLQSEGLKARPTLAWLVAAPISRSDDDGAYKIFCYCWLIILHSLINYKELFSNNFIILSICFGVSFALVKNRDILYQELCKATLVTI